MHCSRVWIDLHISVVSQLCCYIVIMCLWLANSTSDIGVDLLFSGYSLTFIHVAVCLFIFSYRALPQHPVDIHIGCWWKS